LESPPTRTELEEVVHRLAAEAAIRAVLMRYCRAVDRLDIELLRTVYHDDAFDDHGVYSGPVEGFYEFIAAGPERGFEMTQHCLSNILIDLVDDHHAHTETYFFAYHRRRSDQGMVEETSGSRYLDRFERRGGEWRIARRLVVLDWSRVIPLPAGFDSAGPSAGLVAGYLSRASLNAGSRGPDDPSYRPI